MYVDALREYLRACLVCNLSGAEHILGSWGRLSFDGAARGYPTRHRQFLLDRGKDCAGISLVLSQGCASGTSGQPSVTILNLSHSVDLIRPVPI